MHVCQQTTLKLLRANFVKVPHKMTKKTQFSCQGSKANTLSHKGIQKIKNNNISKRLSMYITRFGDGWATLFLIQQFLQKIIFEHKSYKLLIMIAYQNCIGVMHDVLSVTAQIIL